MISWADIRNALILLGVSVATGVTNLAIHDLPVVAAEPDASQASCAGAESDITLVPRISVDAVVDLLERADVTVVDARSGRAHAEGHIPGAISLPQPEAEDLLEVQSVPIPPQNLVITYCDGGACEQSEYLGLLLRDRAGCDQVQVLEGGWQAWLEAKGPIETALETVAP